MGVDVSHSWSCSSKPLFWPSFMTTTSSLCSSKVNFRSLASEISAENTALFSATTTIITITCTVVDLKISKVPLKDWGKILTLLHYENLKQFLGFFNSVISVFWNMPFKLFLKLVQKIPLSFCYYHYHHHLHSGQFSNLKSDHLLTSLVKGFFLLHNVGLCRFCTFLNLAQLASWADFKNVQNLHKSIVTP